MADIVPKDLAKRIAALPESYRNFREFEVIELTYGTYEKIPILDGAVRRSFWEEYGLAIARSRMMKLTNVYRGTCSDMHFYRMVCDPKRLAYIITEPAREKHLADEIIEIGWRRMKEIMEAKVPINEKTGIPDRQLSKLQADIFKYIDQKLNGVPTQRHEIKQQTMQVNIDGGKTPPSHLGTPQEVDKRLAELEHKAANPQIALAAPTGTVNDVEVMMTTHQPPTINTLKNPQKTPKEKEVIDV